MADGPPGFVCEQAELLGEEPIGPLDLRWLTVEVEPTLRARLVEGGVVGAPVDPSELAPLPADEARRFLQEVEAEILLEDALPALPRPVAPASDPQVTGPTILDGVATTAVQLGILPMCLLGRILSGGGGDCAVSPTFVRPTPPAPIPDPLADARAARLRPVVDRIFAPCVASAGVPCSALFLARTEGPQTLVWEVTLEDERGVCVVSAPIGL